MNEIYFDREQCRDFGISYFEKGEISLPADVILRSKVNGYDLQHRNFLESIGKGIVYLRKKSDNGPGWYTVESF